MQINLVGVLVDGSTRASGVPSNPRVALSWPLGSTVSIRLDVKSQVTGGAVDLTGATVQLEARLQPLPLNQQKLLVVVGVAITPFVKGAVTFTITPTMQKLLVQQNVGRCFYDIWVTASDGSRNAVIPTSPLYLEPTVSEIP